MNPRANNTSSTSSDPSSEPGALQAPAERRYGALRLLPARTNDAFAVASRRALVPSRGQQSECPLHARLSRKSVANPWTPHGGRAETISHPSRGVFPLKGRFCDPANMGRPITNRCTGSVSGLCDSLTRWQHSSPSAPLTRKRQRRYAAARSILHSRARRGCVGSLGRLARRATRPATYPMTRVVRARVRGSQRTPSRSPRAPAGLDSSRSREVQLARWSVSAARTRR